MAERGLTTQVQKSVKLVNIRVWTPKKVRRTAAGLEKIQLRAPDGHLFPLKRIASIKTIIDRPQIIRENLKRMIAVTGRISGRDMGSTILAMPLFVIGMVFTDAAAPCHRHYFRSFGSDPADRHDDAPCL